jgi:glycosyltransferase involved in cell wall biosynthesis
MAYLMSEFFGKEIFYLVSKPSPIIYENKTTRIDAIKLLSLRVFRWGSKNPLTRIIKCCKKKDIITLHLPSFELLLIGLVIKACSRNTKVYILWHAYLEPSRSIKGIASNIYQSIANLASIVFDKIIFTSSALASSHPRGNKLRSIAILPPALPQLYETSLLSVGLIKKIRPTILNILFIGRIDTYKRIDIVIDQLARISVERFHFHIAGSGPLLDAYKSLAEKNLPESSFTFYGRISEESKIDLLSKCDCLVLPSVISNEAFGIVQLEAMAAGRPSLTFNIRKSGVADVCRLPSLMWDNQPDSLGHLMQTFVEEPGLLMRLSYEAREHFIENYAYSQWACKLNSIYEA